MNVEEDEYGNMTLMCGWRDFIEDPPSTEDNIVVLERPEPHCLSLAEWNPKLKKWVNAADDTDEVLDIKWWIRVPPVPSETDDEDEEEDE